MRAVSIQRRVRSSAALTLACGFVSTVSAQEYTCEVLYHLDAPSPITVHSYKSVSAGGSCGDGWGPGTLGVPHAIYIPSSTGVPIDLHPLTGYTDTYALACEGNQQVGYGWRDSSGYQAVMWAGSAASLVNLHPGGYAVSEARGTDGEHQVGWAGTTVSTRAMLWSGSASSAVDLHPAGYTNSIAHHVWDGQQVGVAYVTGSISHAMLWTGSAASAVDLHPAGFSSSTSVGVRGMQQVGSGSTPSGTRALLWHGTAASAVDLHPAGHTRSVAAATNGTVQVGEATPTGGSFRACAWAGSADSFVSLHDFLPTGTVWSGSRAMSVDDDGVIYGFAFAAYSPGAPYRWAVRWTPVGGCAAKYNGDDEIGRAHV